MTVCKAMIKMRRNGNRPEMSNSSPKKKEICYFVLPLLSYFPNDIIQPAFSCMIMPMTK